jgi:hypothetical protein
MARVSFSLRRSTVDHGSFVRYDTETYDAAASAGNSASAGTWTLSADRDSDASLRSDGYQLPPVEYAESYLEAYPVAYGVSQIDWGAPLEPIGASPAPSQVVLVYSPYGPAGTVSSGTVLSEGSTEFTYTHNGLVGGQWAYYTLFVRYQSNVGDDYYEPAAYVEILMPENHGSTSLLWNRVPEYYRQQDTEIGEYVDPASTYATQDLGALPPGNVVGPLFKFLSIFGFEMDMTRTLIDYLMVARDPAIANTESIDALARTVGFGASSASLNASRIRAVLDDIGNLRRSKGTLEGVEEYGRALSNSEIEIDTVNREVTFYSQRVNYLTDPLDANITNCSVTHRPAHESEGQLLKFNSGSYDASTYVSGDANTYPTTLEEEYIPGMYWTASSAGVVEGITAGVGDYIVAYRDDNGDITFGVSGYDFSATNYSSYSGSYTNTGSVYTAQGTGASVGVDHVMFHIDCPIPVQDYDTVYFSVHSAVGTSAIKWARLVDESGNIVGTSASLTRAGDSPAAGIIASDNLSSDEWTICFLEFLVDLGSVTTYELSYLMAERNHLGEYFDGSSRRGGWIVDESGGTVGDYRWSSEGENNGNAYQSVSIYTEEYQRTRALLNNFFADSLPITLKDYYTVVATDAIPGQSAIDTYLTTP